MCPDRVTIGALELRVRQDQPLHEVVAGGELLERRDREAGDARVDLHRRAGRECLDIDAEERLARLLGTGLQPRFLPVGASHEQVGATGDLAGVCAGRIGELERLGARQLWNGDARKEKSDANERRPRGLGVS